LADFIWAISFSFPIKKLMPNIVSQFPAPGTGRPRFLPLVAHNCMYISPRPHPPSYPFPLFHYSASPSKIPSIYILAACIVCHCQSKQVPRIISPSPCSALPTTNDDACPCHASQSYDDKSRNFLSLWVHLNKSLFFHFQIFLLSDGSQFSVMS
jgi:hypothetical protein